MLKRKRILLPPPNVTGSLHIGHAFQQILMDAYARYYKQNNYTIEWLPGFDHAGIALHSQVDKLGGSTQEKIAKAHTIATANKRSITEQMQRLCLSVDWTKAYYTLDDNFSDAVNVSFNHLYKKNLIYKGARAVYWDNTAKTVLSDKEVVYAERKSHMYFIQYAPQLVVGTTRPLTILGDVALAVHPDDKRYQSFIGTQIKVPLTDRYIPVIASKYVEMDKGTGCMKITPSHDLKDASIASEAGLDSIDVYNQTLHIVNHPPFTGLTLEQAHAEVTAALKKEKRIVGIEEIQQQVPHSERSNAPLEVIRTSQWFVRAKKIAQESKVVLQDMDFVPEKWRDRCQAYLENMTDWCISRQIWWGHTMPIDNQHVLDTWFSSALCPLVLSGWPKQFERKPFDLLITGFDILLFWVCRMIMFSYAHEKFMPFKYVIITGLIKDEQGQKMSKSRGNVIDPLDLVDGISREDLLTKRLQGIEDKKRIGAIKKFINRSFPNGIEPYGVDVVRCALCKFFSPNLETNFNFTTLKTYKALERKIVNAAKFTQGKKLLLVTVAENVFYQALVDDFLVQCNKAIKQYDVYMEQMRVDLALDVFSTFFYKGFCGWYLEVHKCFNDTHDLDIGLAHGWKKTLYMIRPFMPVIANKIEKELSDLLSYDSK